MVAGSYSAHALSYRLVVSDPDSRAHVLEASGHGYLAETPLVFGVLGALMLAALLGRVSSSLHGARLGAMPSWPFFLLPLAGFALQEHLERLVHTGDLSASVALEPTFLLGLALQLPFALAAFAVARLLLRAADLVGRALATKPPRPGARNVHDARTPACAVIPRQRLTALGYTERGPPIVEV
jgi:hypothetical protein